MEEKEITINIKNPEVILLLIFLGVVFFLELQVTLNSPIAFGDEGHHTTWAKYIGENREYPILEPMFGTKIDKLTFHHKPLWQILQGSFYLIFGFHDVIVKFLTPFIGSVLLGLAVFVLIKKIYNKEVGLIASFISVGIHSLVTYSVLVYTDALLTLYFFLSVSMLILALKENRKRYWILSGIFGAFSILTKNVGYAILPLIGICFLYKVLEQKNLLKPLKEFFLLIAFLALILGSFFIRNFVYYSTPDSYLFGVFVGGEEPGYKHRYEFEGRVEEVGTEMHILKMGIMNYLNFAYGNVWFIVFAFFCGLFALLLRKSREDILILLTLFAIVPIFYRSLGGRAEDTSRYTLGWVPIIASISAVYFEKLYDFIKKYQKHIALVVFLFVIFFSFQNLNEKLNAMKQVKRFSPLFLEACNWIKENVEKDARLMVIWGSATMYNCQRQVGGGGPDVVVSNNLTLALSVLKMQGTTHIFIQKFSISWADRKLSEKYPISFVQLLENNPQNFEKVYENGPSLEQCRQMGGCDGTILYKIKF